MSKDKDVKFIRVNGRVVPIKGKNKKIAESRRSADKTDFLTGAGASVVGSLFRSSPSVRKAASMFSFASGVGTTIKRAKNERSVGDYAREDIKGSILKAAGALGGAVLGSYGLRGAQKLHKAYKAGRKASKAGKAAKIAGLLR